jgi:hypothetical protein
MFFDDEEDAGVDGGMVTPPVADDTEEEKDGEVSGGVM